MADHSALAVLFVSLSIFVFFKYCLGQYAHRSSSGPDAFRFDNVTRTALQHVMLDEFAGSAGDQLQFA